MKKKKKKIFFEILRKIKEENFHLNLRIYTFVFVKFFILLRSKNFTIQIFNFIQLCI